MGNQGKGGGNCGRISGQALVEYTLILLLCTIVVLLVVQTLGESTNQEFVKVNDSLQSGGYGENR
jgi:Flp pilus assembly pilin Flp